MSQFGTFYATHCLYVCWREEISWLLWDKRHGVCFANLQQRQCCSLQLLLLLYKHTHTHTHKSWAVLIEDLISILLCWGRLLASASNNKAPDLNCLVIVPPIITGSSVSRLSQRHATPSPLYFPALRRRRNKVRERLFTFSRCRNCNSGCCKFIRKRKQRVGLSHSLFLPFPLPNIECVGLGWV